MRCRLSKLLPSKVDHQSWISSWLSKLLLSKEINLSLWTWLSPTNTNPGLKWGGKIPELVEFTWCSVVLLQSVEESSQKMDRGRFIQTAIVGRIVGVFNAFQFYCLEPLCGFLYILSLHSKPPSLSGTPETTSSLNALIAAFPCCLLAACLSSLILATGTSSQNALSLVLVVAFVALVTGSIIAYSWPLR